MRQRYYNTDLKSFINQDILSGSVTGETGLKEVKQTFENETETLVHVNVSDGNVKETIDTTVRHPFYVVGYGFRYASELRVGDKVLSVSGDIYEVTSVEIEDLDEPEVLYSKIYSRRSNSWGGLICFGLTNIKSYHRMKEIIIKNLYMMMINVK